MNKWSPYVDEIANEHEVRPARCRNCGNTTGWTGARHYVGERRVQCFWQCGNCGHQIFMTRDSVIRKARKGERQ